MMTVIIPVSSQSNSIITSEFVGIGLDHPAYRLHLFENSSSHMYLNFSNLTTGNSTGEGVLLGIDSNEDFRVHSYEDNDLRFYTNNEFRMILKNDGKLGLGIQNPLSELHILDNEVDADNDAVFRLQSRSSNNDALIEFYENNAAAMSFHYDGGVNKLYLKDLTKNPIVTRMTVERDGNVGIGTEDPVTNLHIAENVANKAILRLQATGATNHSIIEFFKNAQGMSLYYDGLDDNLYITSENPQKTRVAFYGDEGRVGIYNNSGTQTIVLKGAETESTGAEIILKNASGDDMIELDGEGFGNAGHIRLYDTDGTETLVLKGAENTTDGATVLLKDANGNTTIELDADHGVIGGVGRVITDELEIEGGSDLSEYFDIDHTVETENLPGMVVSISPDGSGNLRLSTEAYDRSVAGVISGANGVRTGLMMGQESSIAHGETPVVLAGRAYVFADATFGSIQPGDLLTTSPNIGHVMKVTDYQQAHGAIIGKAMTRLDEGTGYVLVLVNLQ